MTEKLTLLPKERRVNKGDCEGIVKEKIREADNVNIKKGKYFK